MNSWSVWADRGFVHHVLRGCRQVAAILASRSLPAEPCVLRHLPQDVLGIRALRRDFRSLLVALVPVVPLVALTRRYSRSPEYIRRGSGSPSAPQEPNTYLAQLLQTCSEV